jgi:hypothetical protein
MRERAMKTQRVSFRPAAVCAPLRGLERGRDGVDGGVCGIRIGFGLGYRADFGEGGERIVRPFEKRFARLRRGMMGFRTALLTETVNA